MKILQIPVGMLETNAYIVISDETQSVIIIDPGDEADKILPKIPSGYAAQYILLTHNHFDHTGAVLAIKKKLNIKCGIHKLDNIPDMTNFVFNDGDILGKLKVIHTPGHTPGGSCFFMSAEKAGNLPILIAGDTIFAGGGYGRTDLGGSDKDIANSIVNKILTLPQDTIIYPGHGPSTTVEQEKEYWL